MLTFQEASCFSSLSWSLQCSLSWLCKWRISSTFGHVSCHWPWSNEQCRRNIIMSVTCQSHQWTKLSWVNDQRQNAHPVNDINNESVPNSAAALNLFCNIPPFASISSNGQASGDDQRRTEIQSQSMTKSWITVNDNLNDKTKRCPWQVQTMSMASSLIVSEG